MKTVLGLIENISNKSRNYFLEEIQQKELMSKRHKKACTTLNYIEHFLILASTITGYISSFALSSLLGITLENKSSTIRLKLCAISAGIKKA